MKSQTPQQNPLLANLLIAGILGLYIYAGITQTRQAWPFIPFDMYTGLSSQKNILSPLMRSLTAKQLNLFRWKGFLPGPFLRARLLYT